MKNACALFDHQNLDIVDRMHVLHALFHDLTHGAQTLVCAHRRNSVALHQHVALREQFNRLRKHESYIHDKTMAKKVSRDEVTHG